MAFARSMSQLTLQPSADAVRSNVLAVVVAYGRSFEEIACAPWLRAELHSPRETSLHLVHALVYDNSPGALAAAASALDGFSYQHDPGNGGTAAAYHQAVAVAKRCGAQWLLLLDHDTRLPTDYLRHAGACLAAAARLPGALLPWVMHEGTPISPARILGSGTIRPLDRKRRAPFDRLTAIASGALIRSDALQCMLPFPRALWLDYLDHWIFAQLGGCGEVMEIIDVNVQHDLSILRPRLLSLGRLRSILSAESFFVAQLGWKARAVHSLRLFARALRAGATRPDHATAILEHLFAGFRAIPHRNDRRVDSR